VGAERVRASALRTDRTGTVRLSPLREARGPGAQSGIVSLLQRAYLTPPESFRTVSRGDPRPDSLSGEALKAARLTPETWRLEIVAEAGARLGRPRTLDGGNAIDLPALLELGKAHGVRFLKAMQCLNIPQPLGQGLWEGVPLREVLKLAGESADVRRVYYWGFHNDDPRQRFQSSLSYTQVMEAPPWELLPFVAYKLNGEPLPLSRGGPVRMLVPWAHGFKSIKWLRRIVCTNDFRANDTYADDGNDPESYLKTAAYIDEGDLKFAAGAGVTVRGTVISGWSGLKRVEYWLRPDAGLHGTLADDDPAWAGATWEPCAIDPQPDDWKAALPAGVGPGDVWGFDAATGRPRDWPMRYSVATWSAALGKLAAGMYEFRARAVDLNGHAQPEPRASRRSGKNGVQARVIAVGT
jgi:DMSO/TMAO reductase YedYZ molybdopterin-dependent catalytic subunit